MRILCLHGSSDIYGASKIFLQCLSLLRKRGHACTVVLSAPGPLQYELEKIGCTVYIFNLGILRRKYFTPWGLLNRFGKWRQAAHFLKRIIHAEKIDTVYSNTAAVLMGAWVAKKNKLPHYWHIHEIIEQPKLLHSCLLRYMQWGGGTIIAVSNAVRDCWIPTGNITRVYNGIEPIHPIPSNTFRSKYNIPDDAIVLGLAGRIHKIKGQSYFLDIASALLQLQKKHPTTPLFFLIAGDPFPGQAYLVNQMLEKIKALQLNNSVHYLGLVPNMADFYGAIDILVLSSVLPDSFPTVILEAMQCSLPVVATQQGGALEMIIPKHNGILIPINNPSLAAQAIHSILDKPLLFQMGVAGKQFVDENFSLTSFEKNIIQIFENDLHATVNI